MALCPVLSECLIMIKSIINVELDPLQMKFKRQQSTSTSKFSPPQSDSKQKGRDVHRFLPCVFQMSINEVFSAYH